MTIYLRPINDLNWHACIQLEPAPEQEGFVASNAVSLAQAYVESWWQPCGIYADDTLVGFVMHGRWPNTGVAGPDDEAIPGADCILRFMIDARYQGRGYGRAALLATIDRIKSQGNGLGIQLCYVPENAVAARLYAGAGFRPTGRMVDGEVEVWRDW